MNNYKNNEKYKKIIFITVIGLFALVCVLFIALSSINAINNEKEIVMSTGNFRSIEDILEYYGCKFIKQKESSEDGVYLDVYTTFKYDLYENNESNEKFFNNVIDEIAGFIDYKTFRLIDEGKDKKIEIKVVCDGSKVKTIFINGIEDYFIYMNSKLNLKDYKEINVTDILVQAPELLNCIENNWNKDINFGTRESIFQGYYIFFDEGIKTRKIGGKIYNVIFDKNYQKPVVNGFTVGTKSDIIIDKMGKPTFQNSDGSIIGYKGKDIYVFFEKNQISIYRNIEEEGFNSFFKLVDEFLNDEYTLLEFMNELTYIWPDYEEYTYSENTVFLSYPNKGIDIKMNYDNTDGIVLYNNIGVSQDIVNKYIEHTEFVAQLQLDNVFNAEERRVDKENQLSTKCKEYKTEYEKEDDRNRGNLFNYYMKMSENEKIMCAYFISTNGQYPNCELSEGIDTYIWLNEYCFLYSVQGKGIYYYDLKNGVRGVVITGNDNFEIKSYENEILNFDDKTLQIQY